MYFAAVAHYVLWMAATELGPGPTVVLKLYLPLRIWLVLSCATGARDLETASFQELNTPTLHPNTRSLAANTPARFC